MVRIELGKAVGIIRKVSKSKVNITHWKPPQGLHQRHRARQPWSAIILSRGNTEFIEHLFSQEVPEMETGAVEIKLSPAKPAAARNWLSRAPCLASTRLVHSSVDVARVSTPS